MKGHIFIKPNGVLIVRDPINKSPLSMNGEWKPYVGVEGRYWRRRVRDGSVIESKHEIKGGKKWQ